MLRITVLALALFGVTLAMRDQSIAIHGKLLCGAKPASNVRVKLWEGKAWIWFEKKTTFISNFFSIFQLIRLIFMKYTFSENSFRTL